MSNYNEQLNSAIAALACAIIAELEDQIASTTLGKKLSAAKVSLGVASAHTACAELKTEPRPIISKDLNDYLQKCQHCGKLLYHNTDTCPNCGYHIPAPLVIGAKAADNVCPDCGATVPDDDADCPQCGAAYPF